ncbi:ribosomal RNA small subunit methyltransferase F [Escherichia coli]|nr:ribosomal RNA small subunit methyltransferase F [Escherichia coli]
MLNCAPVFLPVVHARGQHTVYFPDAFLTQMREAMPSTLLI